MSKSKDAIRMLARTIIEFINEEELYLIGDLRWEGMTARMKEKFEIMAQNCMLKLENEILPGKISGLKDYYQSQVYRLDKEIELLKEEVFKVNNLLTGKSNANGDPK